MRAGAGRALHPVDIDRVRVALGGHADIVIDARRAELAGIARDLESLRKGKKSWASEIVTLFKAIPARLEGDGTETFEVAFE